MTLKQFLEKHKMINTAGLGAAMWPTVKNPRGKINQKLNELKAGTGTQRITEQDTLDAIKVLKAMAKDIDKIK